ncbi:MAG: outer membrane beta-barrel protein [Candidatus Acidiferrales bacterium]
MNKVLWNSMAKLVTCALLAGVSSVPSFAQSATASSGQQASDADQRAAIVQELDAMKKRIADLEAELKKKDAQAPQSKTSKTAPAKPSDPSVASATPPSAQAADPPAAEASAAQVTTTEAVSAPTSDPAPAVASSNESSSVTPAAQESTSPVPATPQKAAKIAPFSDHDWTWLNGNPRTETPAFDSKFFTPEIRADATYTYDFDHPTDHSMGGSSELFRSQEVQLEQLGVGGDFHYDNVRARLMTQFGMYSVTTPRNDASPAHGQWDLADAYRYVSEAYGGYHWDVMHGINLDAGIFMSYIGLFSYYNFDNWAYQPSYVSSNTPWFFNGVRVQIFPTAHLKIEPWFINGWQSYGSANHTPGVGGQIKWTPTGWINIISNNYGVGQDDLFVSGRERIHTDDSIEIKYFDQPENTLDKMAFSLTGDLGCEYGGGVSCDGNKKGGPKQSFIGFMGYNRFWFHKDLFGLTLGGGKIDNPGRYLVLLPPINGESAITAATNSPYFTENPGDPFKAWDSSFTFDYMPSQYITFRWEYDYRHANVPYWSGSGGITPPGGNNGSPEDYACISGASSGQMTLAAAETACGGGISSVWFPDLRKNESFIDLDLLVKF